MKRGFTLLETLLVIAVLAVIASFSIMAMRRVAMHNRVQKTAIEMQAVIQAAMAYNVNTETWPEGQTDCAALPASIPLGLQTFVQSYLPNSSGQVVTDLPNKLTSNIGYPFCWGPDPVETTVGGPNVAAPQFWVALKVPTGAGNQVDWAYAQALKARLPDAVVVTDTPTGTDKVADLTACASTDASCYVLSEVTQPGPTSNAEGGSSHIIGLGHCVSGELNVPGSVNGLSCTAEGPKSSLQPDGTSACTNSPGTNNPCDIYQYKVAFSCPVGSIPEVSASLAKLTRGSMRLGLTKVVYKTMPVSKFSITTEPQVSNVLVKVTALYALNTQDTGFDCEQSQFGPLSSKYRESFFTNCLGYYNDAASFNLKQAAVVDLTYVAYCRQNVSATREL